MSNHDDSPGAGPSPLPAPAASLRPRAASWFAHYTFVDYATQAYLALVGLIILFLHGGSVPHWLLLLAAHAVGIGLVHALIQAHAARPRNRLLDFLRHFYPVLLYTAFYRETGALNQEFYSGFLDPYFIRLERNVLGLQPSLAFMDRLPYFVLSELLYAAYFSYYLMIIGVGLALFFRNRRQFFHYVSVISFVFYACYLIYIFLPVMGPRIFFREITDYTLPANVVPAVPPTFPAAVQAGLFYRIMAWIYRVFEAPGAAFPSSHVAIAISTLYFTFRYLRPVRWVHLVVVVLLCVSTVYCRYHYVVDVVAGVLTAAVLIPLGNRLYFQFTEPEELPAPPGRRGS
jgi:membrane-associated phospholipid phosphatase